MEEQKSGYRQKVVPCVWALIPAKPLKAVWPAGLYDQADHQRTSPSPLGVQQPLPEPAFRRPVWLASGKNVESQLVEIVELPAHPFFIGVQYHPELKSTVENPHPIFVNFVKAAKEYTEQKTAVKNPLLQSEMI